MTTTYSISGTRVEYFDNDITDEGVIVGIQPTVFTLTLPDSVSTFSYSVLPNSDPDDVGVSVSFDTGTANAAALDGVLVNDILQQPSFDD